jgi:hypothetical protein
MTKQFAKYFCLWIAITLVVACAANLPADKAKSRDDVQIDRRRSMVEQFIRRTDWRIERYKIASLPRDPRARAALRPFAVTEFSGNLMLNEGINELWTLVAGGSATAYNNTNARCGVGDSTTAEAATQTDLQAATNKLYKAQNSGFPTFGTSQQIVFKCDYTGSEANFAWNEFTVDNGSTAAKNLNRKVSSQGTKTSGQTWTLTLTITLS